jgi:hypothetical protein
MLARTTKRKRRPRCFHNAHCLAPFLALGTSNRLARVVDRTRVVYADLARYPVGSTEPAEWMDQLDSLRLRGKLLLRALRLFYATLGLFAASALVSVGGLISIFYGAKAMFVVSAGLAVMTGFSAGMGLATGCVLMVQETRLAVQSLAKRRRKLEGPALVGHLS